MKALFSSDLHGEIHLYHDLWEVALASCPDWIALGGDLLPSFPPTKRYEDMLPNQKRFVAEFLSPYFKKMLHTTSVKQVFLIPGNWDPGYSNIFRSPVDGVIDLSLTLFRLENGFELVGYPFVPPTPFRPKDYERMDDPESTWPPQKNPSYVRSEGPPDQLLALDPYPYLRARSTIRDDLNRLPEPISYQKTIYVMHSPPYGTHLDCIQGRKSAGSRSIKDFIQAKQPFLTLHGHIHESPQVSGSYVDRIGRTACINPGQFTSASPKLHAATFDLEDLEKTLTHSCLPGVSRTP